MLQLDVSDCMVGGTRLWTTAHLQHKPLLVWTSLLNQPPSDLEHSTHRDSYESCAALQLDKSPAFAGPQALILDSSCCHR